MNKNSGAPRHPKVGRVAPPGAAIQHPFPSVTSVVKPFFFALFAAFAVNSSFLWVLITDH